MTFIILLLVVAAGAFGYLVYKHGYQAAIAAVVAYAAAAWAYVEGLFDKVF